MKKKISFIATDVRHDCLRCAFNGEKCGMPCEKMARKLDVEFTYAIVEKDPEKEYIGG